MSQKSRLGRLPGMLYVGAMVLISALWLMHAQQKQNSNFTGSVNRVEENPQASVVHIHFEPGARTKWHMHQGGQIILLEDGVGRTQLKGGPVKELHAGDTTYAPPGVAHWHGAAPDKAATQFNVARGTTTWLDEVTEREYQAQPAR